jgi:hypothetical protein
MERKELFAKTLQVTPVYSVTVLDIPDGAGTIVDVHTITITGDLSTHRITFTSSAMFALHELLCDWMKQHKEE